MKPGPLSKFEPKLTMMSNKFDDGFLLENYDFTVTVPTNGQL